MAADAFRHAACGRVVALLTSKTDAPERVACQLASALEETPMVMEKPVVRIDVCVVMMLMGALVVLVWNHVRELSDLGGEAEGEEEDRYE